MLQIREMNPSDAKEITELANQLGYNIAETAVAKQMSSLLPHPDHLVFVGVQNEAMVGFIHGCKMLRLTSPTFWEICGLVVSQEYRRQGIGKKLVQHLEKTIEADTRVRVRCNVKRTSAHLFYEDVNYLEKKEQKVFEK